MTAKTRTTLMKYGKPLAATLVMIAVVVTAPVWWPKIDRLAETLTTRSSAAVAADGLHADRFDADDSDDHAGHAHDDHGHEKHGHDETTSLELSPQAMQNLGLTGNALAPVQLTTFDRAISLPATIVDRPGRTHVQVSAPLTGVVTHVAAIEGEAVEPGDLLMEMRVTHEDLVDAQTDFLKTLGELEVEEKEIVRLRKVTSSGAVAGKVLLERQYARDKLDAILKAQRQALLLHGLSEEQVGTIAEKRRLLRTVRVFVPTPGEDSAESFRLAGRPGLPVSLQVVPEPSSTAGGEQSSRLAPMTLDDLLVQSGQAVETGAPLCVLADLSELYIEALAFEQDVESLTEAVRKDLAVTAVFDRPGGRTTRIDGLQIRLLENQVDPQSRTLSVFVELPNTVVRDTRDATENRFVDWRFRPGQRLQLRVPVEQWKGRIVLPVDAVAREGAESFVFVQNGDHFDRVPVRVEYRDQFEAVIAADGTVFPGDVVARRGAHQMQMALKNKAGGGVDPHAGHNH